jgi:hypothetical protein
MYKAQIIHDLACAINAVDGSEASGKYLDEQVARSERLQVHMVAVANQLWKGTNGNKPVSIKALNLALNEAGWEDSIFREKNGKLVLVIGWNEANKE